MLRFVCAILIRKKNGCVNEWMIMNTHIFLAENIVIFAQPFIFTLC